jgi:hypothetical protein
MWGCDGLGSLAGRGGFDLKGRCGFALVVAVSFWFDLSPDLWWLVEDLWCWWRMWWVFVEFLWWVLLGVLVRSDLIWWSWF